MRKNFAFIILLFSFGASTICFFGFFTRCARQKRVENLLEAEPARIVRAMSLEQKVGQILHVGMPGKSVGPAITAELKHHFAGGVILFGMNLGSAEEIRALGAELQKMAIGATGIPLFISTDQEGGRVKRVDERSVDQFPAAMALGQTAEPRFAREVGFVTAYRLREAGINLVLAPVLDVNNNPGNPVINTRSFGSEADLVTTMGRALATGVREAGSTPTIKHFPGHGDTARDSHLTLPRIDKTLAELENVELKPFRASIEDGAEVVMSAHILFPALDAKYPATLSPAILKDVLRNKLGFQGLIMTDAMEMHAISQNYSEAAAAKQAFRAGADIILLTSLGKISRDMVAALLDGFRSGELSVADLDRSVERQIALKLRKGLFHRHGSPLVKDQDSIIHYKEAEAEITRRYIALRDEYGKKGETLNSAVSRASISALRREFPGLKNVPPAKILVFASSANIRERAKQLGIARILAVGNPAGLVGRVAARPPGEVWLVEIPMGTEPGWNALVAALNARKTAAPTLGLHYSNPFVPIAIPAQGGVLESFSPTHESMRALVDRALDGKPVRRANLKLAGENENTRIGPSGFPER